MRNGLDFVPSAGAGGFMRIGVGCGTVSCLRPGGRGIPTPTLQDCWRRVWLVASPGRNQWEILPSACLALDGGNRDLPQLVNFVSSLTMDQRFMRD